MNQTARVSARSSETEGRAFVVMIVAAGSGLRLGYGMPKAKVGLGDRTILERALDAVAQWGRASLVVVTLPPDEPEMESACRRYGAVPVVGGRTRAESVAAGLSVIREAPESCGTHGVLVHDAARCLTPVHVFDAVAGALTGGERAVIPVLPVTDTIKAVDSSGYVASTPSRAELRVVQTPQGFELATLLEAHREVATMDPEVAASMTDDAMLAETLEIPVATVPGSAESFKITVPQDLVLARAMLLGDRD